MGLYKSIGVNYSLYPYYLFICPYTYIYIFSISIISIILYLFSIFITYIYIYLLYPYNPLYFLYIQCPSPSERTSPPPMERVTGQPGEAAHIVVVYGEFHGSSMVKLFCLAHNYIHIYIIQCTIISDDMI